MVDVSTYASLQAAVDGNPDGTTFTAPSGYQAGATTLDSRKGITFDGITFNDRLTLNFCTTVTVSNCRFNVSDIGAWLVGCTSCTVTGSTFTGCELGGYSPVGCTFSSNTIVNAPQNGIGFAGYAANPCLNNRYTANVIQNCGRIGIEEYPAEGVNSCRGTVVDRNQITAPVSMGVSCMGLDPVIIRNFITNPGWAGIEVVGNNCFVGSNTITSSTYGAAGICVNSTDPSITGNSALVNGNAVVGCFNGITLVATQSAAPMRNVVVSANVVTDCSNYGVNCLTGFEAGGLQANGNVVTFTKPSQSGQTRIGIKTSNNVSLNGNRVVYATTSAGGPSADMPVSLVGNNVKLANSVIDGGGRTTLTASSAQAPAGTYTGWQYLANRWFNGATVNKTGTAAIVDTDTYR